MATEQQNQNKRAERMQEQLSQLRKKAAAVEQALQNEARRKRILKASGNDELIKKIIAYFIDDDFSTRYSTQPNITPEELQGMIDEITSTDGGVELYNSYEAEWNGLKHVAHFIKTSAVLPYLLEVATLFGLIAKYEEVAMEVNKLNVVYDTLCMAMGGVAGDAGKSIVDTTFNTLCKEPEFTEYLRYQPTDATKPVQLNKKKEKELYSEIQKQAKIVSKNMAEIKGCMDAAFEYLKTGRLGILPCYFENTDDQMTNNTNELYRFNNKEKYYRGFLNDKIAEGYEPTEEDEKWAIIPDYKAIKRDKKAYEYIKAMIRRYTHA